MPVYRRAGEERINTFLVEDRYLFKHYFEEDAVFHRLKQYYNNQQYRFEIPSTDFDEVTEHLQEYGYALVEVSVIEEFLVVVEKYTDHPENIFKDSVLHRGTTDHNVFLMKDQVAVEEAVSDGAKRITETDVSVPF